MFIQTETTPNPATLKFLPGTAILPGRTADFRKAADAAKAPLAVRLFEVNGVDGVFLGHDFVSVTKADGSEWNTLKPQVLAALMEHLTKGLPVMLEEGAEIGPEELGEIEAQIVELLETRVRPAVAQDGGDIMFDRFEDGVVYLHLRGACAGCPSSTATLKSGIENMLRYYVPEVMEVRAVM